MKGRWLFLLLLLYFGGLFTQVGIDDLIESRRLLNQDASSLTDVYNNYLTQPLSLNAKEEVLRLFPFWSYFQVEEVLNYRRKLGGFVDVEELKLLKLFSDDDYLFLLPLLTVTEVAVVLGSQKIRGEYLTRVGHTDKLNNFLGGQYNYQSRLKLVSHNIKLSLVLQKDKGELLLNPKRGVDFLGVSVGYKYKDYKFVLGDYQLNIGEGLLIWQSFGVGKNFSMPTTNKCGEVLQAKSGVDEFSFYRGGVVSRKWRKFRLLTFYSQRNLDASTNDRGHVTSVRRSGLHRTASEISGDSQLQQISYGMHLGFKNRNFSVASTLITDRYSKALEQRPVYQNGLKPYKNHHHASLAWGITKHRWVQYGECVSNLREDYSAVLGNKVLISDKTTVDLAFRTLAADIAVYSNPFSEKEGVPEKGFYLGVQSQLLDFAHITFYRDQYLFDFGLTHKPYVSEGVDYGVQLDTYFNGLGKLFFRVKYERQNDFNEVVFLHELMRYRLHFQTTEGALIWQSRLEFSYLESLGWMYFLQVKREQRYITTVFRSTFFDVPAFNQAIYAFTPNLRYAYRNYAYHKRGIQHIVKFRAQLRPWLKPSLVTSYMMYFDQNTPDFFEISLQLEASL